MSSGRFGDRKALWGQERIIYICRDPGPQQGLEEGGEVPRPLPKGLGSAGECWLQALFLALHLSLGIAILLTVLFIEVFIRSGMERGLLASCLPVTRHIHVYNTRLSVAPRAPPLPALMTRQCPKASGLLGSRPPSFTPLFSLLHLHRLVAGWVFLTQVVGSRGSLQ